ALQASVAQAERLVQQDQTRVNQDASRLEQSRNQLTNDKQSLSDTQRESNQAAQPALQAARPVNLNSAIEQPSPAEQAAATPALLKPQINTQGETIGKLINVVA
uniref:hypothetical protein n=1 Tax=Undibacterium sp. TaxID=1914977 RepID=UPI00374CCB1E